MMPSKVRIIRRVSLLAVVLVLFGGAAGLARLHHLFLGQRIDIRYTPGASEDARFAFERQSGLVEATQEGPHTWRYFLTKRSRADIQALIANPIVEDTSHIDRARLRVDLDRPDLPPPLLELAHAAWLPWASGLLAVCAFATLWLSLRDLLPDARRVRAAIHARVTAMREMPATTRERLTLVIVGVATALVLPLAVEPRPDEAGFVHLYEAVSLLAGDHPYRDFFEWGAPLPMVLSAAAQWLVGYRVIGELAVHWALTVAAVLIAFRLGLRQSASSMRMFVVLPLALLVALRAGYHFSKLFAIPLGILAAWRYLDRPTPSRSAVMGCVVVVAFLFRHDFAIWTGLATLLALALVRLIRPETRRLRSVVADGAACALSAAALALPWLFVVGSNEGLVEYVEARAERFVYSRDAGYGNPYAALLEIDPFQQLRAVTVPPALPGTVTITWEARVDEARRRALETERRMRPLAQDQAGSITYEVVNQHDLGLLNLRDEIDRSTGINWERLEDARRHLPSADGTEKWLAQMTMLVPLVLMASGLFELWRHRSRPEPSRTPAAQRLLAGLVLAGASAALIREWSYFLTVAPVTVALSARFLGINGSPAHRPNSVATVLVRRLRLLPVGLALVLLTLSTYAAYVRSPAPFHEPMSSIVPLITGRWHAWITPEPTGNNALYQFLRNCTVPTDRLLVTGSTPYYTPYYTHRAMAGGHLDWSVGVRGLRSDPYREGQSLALLKQQSVPFVIGRRPDVIDVFRRYPRIHEYLLSNYAPINGSQGSLLYDTRRTIVRTVGDDHRPCFR